MTALLASVNTAAEVRTVLATGADVIDLKDPRSGALGALPLPTIRALAKLVDGHRPVSATVGDLPAEPAALCAAAAATATTGVDFVKVGLFGSGDFAACVAALGVHAARGVRLVAVLFADQQPPLELLGALARAGFAGVMLDTAEKSGGGLRRHLDDRALGGFVDGARAAGLLVGLAGSLRLADIAPLLRLRPDYLGFRGALCGQGTRTDALDPAAAAAVRAAMPQVPGGWPAPSPTSSPQEKGI